MIETVSPETPVERVTRIGHELALALNDYANGTRHAVIHPSAKQKHCVCLVFSDLPVDEDPLVAAIKAYEDGLEDFNTNSPTDDPGANAYAAVSYEPPMRALEEWSRIARSPQAVHAALRLAERTNRDGDGKLSASMIKAALGFYERVS